MIDLLSRVEKYINSEETMKFATTIEVLELNLVEESPSNRKDDEYKFERNDKRL